MFYNRKLLLAIGATITLSTISPIVSAKPQRYDHAVITDGDKLIGESQKQLHQIRVCLGKIAPIIKKNDKYEKLTREKIASYFKNLDQVLEQFEKDKFIEVDTLAVAGRLMGINNAFIDHINDILKTNFKGIDSYDINEIISMAVGTKSVLVEPQKIAEQLIRNSQKLDKLDKKAQGLRWYNHLFRFVDDKLITPCEKYSIPRRALLVAGIVGLGEIAWWLVNEESHKKWHSRLTDGKHSQLPDGVYGPLLPARNYNKWIGPHPKENKNGALINDKMLGYAGKIYQQWYLWASGLSAAGFLLNHVKNGLGAETQVISPKIKKQATILRNKLRGGVYTEEANRIANKIDHVRFKDIHGQDEIKRYMQQLVDYIEDSEGADRLGVGPSHGILLIGETRTGKTFCVNALHGEIKDMQKRTGQSKGFELIHLDAITIQKQGIDFLLKYVKEYAPCIIFIDEIDLLNL